MIRFVWITGRAASGKSTLIAEVEAHLRDGRRAVHRLSDEDLLFGLKTADISHEHHWHPDEDPARFLLRSGHFFDEGVRIISAHLVDLMRADDSSVAIVELARGRAAAPIDVSYRRALELTDQRIWPHSTVFRLVAPFAVQSERNRQRAAAPGGRATPAAMLYDLYRDDDPDTLVQAGIPVVGLDGRADPRDNASVVLRAMNLEK